jgi:hypothetical protein
VKEATSIICKRWEICPHPEKCENKCFDEDIKQDYHTNKDGQVVYVDRENGGFHSIINFTGFNLNEK